MVQQKRLLLPVVTLGAEHLVTGYLMRRNILTYKAPPRNEGYDLICIHPDPRNITKLHNCRDLIRVQVKSRYATDAYRTFPLKEESLDAFDFLIAVYLNIGNFFGKSDGLTGSSVPEFYTFPNEFIREHHEKTARWQQVNLRNLDDKIEPFKNETGFEQIARALGIPKPRKKQR